MPSKRHAYEELLAQLDLALEREFYFEASWIAYGVIEDRANSLLEKSGGWGGGMLGQKLRELSARCETDLPLKEVPGLGGAIASARAWIQKRNPLMHQLIGLPRPMATIRKEAELLAAEGNLVVRTLAAEAMKVRKRHVKRTRAKRRASLRDTSHER